VRKEREREGANRERERERTERESEREGGEAEEKCVSQGWHNNKTGDCSKLNSFFSPKYTHNTRTKKTRTLFTPIFPLIHNKQVNMRNVRMYVSAASPNFHYCSTNNNNKNSLSLSAAFLLPFRAVSSSNMLAFFHTRNYSVFKKLKKSTVAVIQHTKKRKRPTKRNCHSQNRNNAVGERLSVCVRARVCAGLCPNWRWCACVCAFTEIRLAILTIIFNCSILLLLLFRSKTL